MGYLLHIKVLENVKASQVTIDVLWVLFTFSNWFQMCSWTIELWALIFPPIFKSFVIDRLSLLSSFLPWNNDYQTDENHDFFKKTCNTSLSTLTSTDNANAICFLFTFTYRTHFLNQMEDFFLYFFLLLIL